MNMKIANMEILQHSQTRLMNTEIMNTESSKPIFRTSDLFQNASHEYGNCEHGIRLITRLMNMEIANMESV